jgi:Winged helix-turn helix
VNLDSTMANKRRFAMAAAVGLRGDYDAGVLRVAAKRSKDGPQARRLLALAAIYDGASRTEAAKIGGVVAEQTLSRVLRKMGYRKLSARPRHYAQAEGAIEDFKKAFPRAWMRSGARRASSPAQ